MESFDVSTHPTFEISYRMLILSETFRRIIRSTYGIEYRSRIELIFVYRYRTEIDAHPISGNNENTLGRFKYPREYGYNDRRPWL